MTIEGGKEASLVERLEATLTMSMFVNERHLLREALRQRAEAAARIRALEDENDQLRLAILGGEDAPGHASSLPLVTVLQVHKDNLQAARRDSELAWDGETASSWKAQASTYREAWGWLSARTNLELSFEYDLPEAGDEGAWQVHRVSGGRSDREWELLGFGQTALEAVTAAKLALQGDADVSR